MKEFKNMVETVSIDAVIPNKDNPRILKDDKFKKLVKSIQEFPEMLQIRPIVVNADNIVLGGNMRLEACKKAGLKEVTILKAEHLTEEQQKEFIIKDNSSFGQWDWDALANNFDQAELVEWGIDEWNFGTVEDEIDYSILDDEDVENDLDQMNNGVRKAIQIDFDIDHYEEATELVKFWREQDAYVGGLLLEKLRQEKEKL